jgi:hypothetical protein
MKFPPVFSVVPIDVKDHIEYSGEEVNSAEGDKVEIYLILNYVDDV